MAIRPLELVWIGYLLGACTAPPAPLTIPPATVAADCPQPLPAASPSPSPAKATPAARATNAYKGLQSREANAVTAPAATASYVRAIHRADDLAREALRELIAQDGNPKPEAIKAARDSIDNLVQTLETTEGGGSM